MENKSNKFVILFAGAVGSSKSPIATYLSFKLDLPIFIHDVIRTEVKEDLGKMDVNEYAKRRDERLREIIAKGDSFIYDASVDRSWEMRKAQLLAAGYKYCIVSLDLSISFLEQLCKIKNYTETLTVIDNFVLEHNTFLNRFKDDVIVHITDETFPSRLNIAYNAVKKWIDENSKLI
ncbi:MAG TPA: hypothetical protein P5096_03250 [Patescibacteria group bacterium]|nr:hypothetical protein [Patescibacteria group bacterium]